METGLDAHQCEVSKIKRATGSDVTTRTSSRSGFVLLNVGQGPLIPDAHSVAGADSLWVLGDARGSCDDAAGEARAALISSVGFVGRF